MPSSTERLYLRKQCLYTLRPQHHSSLCFHLELSNNNNKKSIFAILPSQAVIFCSVKEHLEHHSPKAKIGKMTAGWASTEKLRLTTRQLLPGLSLLCIPNSIHTQGGTGYRCRRDQCAASDLSWPTHLRTAGTLGFPIPLNTRYFHSLRSASLAFTSLQMTVP